MTRKVVHKKGKDTIRNRSPHSTRSHEMSNQQLLAHIEANPDDKLAAKELTRRSPIGIEGKKSRQAKKASSRDKAAQAKQEKAAHHALYSGDSRKMK
jgi:hypothetical protein